MNRKEALEWCVENVDEWENAEVSHNTLDIDENWYFFFNGEHFQMINVCEKPESPIAKRDWLEAKKNKEKVEVSKDLMMKAAIKYQGKWPDDRNNFLALLSNSMTVSGKETIVSVPESFSFSETWKELCTREQFEAFVESLFVGAPEGTTHFRPDSPAKWYKVSEETLNPSASFWFAGAKWDHSMSYEQGEFSIVDLIPRPLKKIQARREGNQNEKIARNVS